MTLSLQSFALRVWWKPRAFKPTWKISSLNKGREDYAVPGRNISQHLSILNGNSHLKYHRDCIRSVCGFICRSWCNIFLWCYEKMNSSAGSWTTGSKTQPPLTAYPRCLRVVCLERPAEDVLNRDFLLGGQTVILSCEQNIWTILQEQARKLKFVKVNCWKTF